MSNEAETKPKEDSLDVDYHGVLLSESQDSKGC